jgi:hypothetical protein
LHTDFLLFLDDLAGVQVNVEGNELGVLLDQVLELGGIQVILGLLLQVQRDTSTATKLIVLAGIEGDAEGVGIRLPNVLSIIVVLGGDNNTVSNQESRVETDTELTDEVGSISTLLL